MFNNANSNTGHKCVLFVSVVHSCMCAVVRRSEASRSELFGLSFVDLHDANMQSDEHSRHVLTACDLGAFVRSQHAAQCVLLFCLFLALALFIRDSADFLSVEDLKSGDHLTDKSLNKLGLVSLLANEEIEELRRNVVLVCCLFFYLDECAD